VIELVVKVINLPAALQPVGKFFKGRKKAGHSFAIVAASYYLCILGILSSSVYQRTSMHVYI
jgi:hypothetical protein